MPPGYLGEPRFVSKRVVFETRVHLNSRRNPNTYCLGRQEGRLQGRSNKKALKFRALLLASKKLAYLKKEHQGGEHHPQELCRVARVVAARYHLPSWKGKLGKERLNFLDTRHLGLPALGADADQILSILPRGLCHQKLPHPAVPLVLLRVVGVGQVRPLVLEDGNPDELA